MTTPHAPAQPTSTLPTPPRGPLDRFLRWTDARRPTILVANLVAQIGIIVTGGLVRLTGSGLGCSTWPQCEPGSFTPVYHPETAYHSAIEFGNRTLTFVLCVVAGLTAVAVWRQRERLTSYRVLGLVPLIGVVVQAVVGGITVLVDLHPAVVGSHMFISLALVAASTWLIVRHAEGDGPARAVLPSPVRAVAAVTGVLAVPMLVLGVVTTGAGPHSGDDEVAYRFALDPAHAAKLHGISVWFYVASVVVLAVLVAQAARGGSDARRPRRALVLVGAVIALQAAIGYTQYFTDLPIALVLLHMLGAALSTAVATNLVLSTRVRD
ncbi:cytochrome c oxidase assembly protein subunit 15 [Flavimobilis soli]|uniref:Cytochrome c oxidase assembly protein subunit 15 n=1 Tax=Flavimobilis soli TaxID=442709 RepID=A0A2A9EC23_9MICO|nr:COX15/CtaA family protein [Flavimobilis soli]PFG35812.1 cytochrome c oxidase assembly protein subunit 15 [Flavimobilis soli]